MTNKNLIDINLNLYKTPSSFDKKMKTSGVRGVSQYKRNGVQEIHLRNNIIFLHEISHALLTRANIDNLFNEIPQKEFNLINQHYTLKNISNFEEFLTWGLTYVLTDDKRLKQKFGIFSKTKTPVTYNIFNSIIKKYKLNIMELIIK